MEQKDFELLKEFFSKRDEIFIDIDSADIFNNEVFEELLEENIEHKVLIDRVVSTDMNSLTKEQIDELVYNVHDFDEYRDALAYTFTILNALGNI